MSIVNNTPNAPRLATLRRGRGRPPSHGKYVGLAKAQAELTAAQEKSKKEELLIEEDRRIAMATQKVVAGRLRMSKSLAEDATLDQSTSVQLQTHLQDALEAITLVSKKSKGLKGTSQKSLKEAVASISKIAEIFLNRTSSEEINKWQVENNRLTAEVAELKRQHAELRADMQRRHKEKDEKSAESDLAALVRKELAEFRTSLSVMEARILRPPLAANTRTPGTTPATTYAAKTATPRAGTATTVVSEPAVSSQTAPNATELPAQIASGKRRKKGKNKEPATQLPASQLPASQLPAAQLPASQLPAPQLPTTASTPQTHPTTNAGQRNGSEWETVGERKKAGKQNRQEAKKAKKLRPPRSAAIVLTLQPAAVEKGTTYADLLKKARSSIDPAKYGITAGLRCKSTQTGARLIEVPGVTSGDQADRLAEGLREILSADDVRVTRPHKSAELRLSGLDDSIDRADVVAAMANAGECPPAQIRCGVIRQGRSGMGTVVVGCPVATAKKLADGRRLLVGWVSAQVKLLDPKPQRCYRCLTGGHVGAKCTSEVNCSGRCYQCGQPGHTASTCELPPHCVLCAAAKKAADHRAGSKTCAATKTTTSLSSKSRPSAKNKVVAPAAEEAELTQTQ